MNNIKQLSIKNIHKNVSKLPILHKIFILLLIYVFYLTISKRYKESYTGMSDFTHKIDNDCYDDFYCKYYDFIFLDERKNKYEIEFISKLIIHNSSRILDIGSGTGNHVSLLTDKFIDTIGIDQSPSMVNIAKDKFPHCVFKNGNFLESSNNLEDDKYDVITCFGKTIYSIQNKDLFIKKVNNMLNSDGFFIVHLVDRDKFKPIKLYNNESKILFNPEKYNVNSKIDKILIKFDNAEYKSNYNKYELTNTYNNVVPYSYYRDEFYDYSTHNVRRNDINLYMPTMNEIINIAKENGFIYHSKISLDIINYPNEFIYAFKKS
jgi:ubiquinone/menaquinone biosynthesis C-methylase UbiE